MALSLANFYPFEDTLAATSVTLTFPWKPKEIKITNNSVSGELEFKFSLGETYATLRGGETITVRLSSRTVHLNSIVSVEYRVWGIG